MAGTGMILGVTGSRYGGGFRREEKFFQFLCRNDVSELHHGDCIGWDEECHNMGAHYGIKIVIHPPIEDRYRAFCKGGFRLPPKPYLDRNKDIVDAVDFLIAAPDGPERQRSGTWSTVRYAKKVGVNGVVWLP